MILIGGRIFVIFDHSLRASSTMTLSSVSVARFLIRVVWPVSLSRFY